MKFLSLFIVLFFSLNIYSQNYSNAGKEFWVGYGHNSLFDVVNGGANTQEMVLYIGSNQDAVVTVSINGTPFSISYNIPAFTVIQTAPIPKAGGNDPRLTTEGVNSRGIHIVSDVPIVAYAHQYGLNSSGATMLMPVETYGYTYFSVNYTQLTNVNVPCYSWFYAVASENNTRLQITPSVATQGGRPAGVPFTVNLSKGEIYNVFGSSVAGSGTGLDVTGSKIQSIAGADGKCHPIGVFSGSSRITICGSSGDILQQQIFPSSAWGTNFYTYPTINTTNINQTNLNYYRIAVRDPATKVKKNGVLLTGLINNFYYEYSSSTGDFIEANKPILISQYVPSMQFCNIYNGNGDPEMFYLSPLQQAVNETYFYNTNNQNILDNYVSIITKTAGVSSILIDGLGVVGSVTPHPQNNEYSVIVQALNGNQQHIIKGDSTFTAITYGFGNFESYGYNAGTLINNLDIIPSIKNTFSSGTKPSLYACLNSPFNISLTMAYKATKMVWKFSQINIPTPKITPGYDTTLINPVPYDSVVIDSRLYYKYKLPNNYVLKDTGTFNIPISITAPEIDNCNNTLDFIYSVRVNEVPKPSISVNYSTCLQDTAFLLTTGITGFPIQNFIWTFDDGTQNFTQNPRKRFPTIGPHPIKLRLITYEGCISDTIINTVTNPNPTTTFGIATLPACEGSTLTFTDTSVFGGKLGRWYWDFGNGQTRSVTVNNPQTATYTTPGIYTIKHLAQSTGSCASDTAKKTIQIFAKPVAKFFSKGGCLLDSTVRFTDSSKVSDGQVLNYLWDFGDPNANGTNPNTSTLKNPTHKYIISGTYTVKLTVTTVNGCSNIFTSTVTIFPLPTTNFTINNAAQCINGNGFLFTNATTISGGVLNHLWNFGDGATSTLQNPSHVYSTAGSYNVTLISTSNNGCKDTIMKVVTVYPKPNPVFTINQTTQCENSNSFVFNNTSTISSGTLSYNWHFGDGSTSTQFNPVKVYSASGTYIVKLVVTSDKGCKDSITRTVTVNEKPFVDFNIAVPVQCGNSVFNFIDLSKITNGSLTFKWYFGDGATSTSQNPTHSYTFPGVYAVKLVVTSNNGCKDSIIKSVTSLAPPVAAFNVAQSKCLVGNNFVFQNTSTTPTGSMSFIWDFGDGATSTAVNPSHSYTAAGIYIVKLNVTTTNGCKGLFTDTLTVHVMPKASYNIANTSQCITGNSFSFTNTSTLTTGTTTFLWSLGDGTTATTQNATHSYTTPGTYNVKLLVLSQQGCKDSITKTVVVNPKPGASFSINTIAQCITNNNFSFTNTSSVSSGTLSYQWYFGDGASSLTQNANHTYATSGSFQVKLIATTNNGCKDSIIQTVSVGPKPTAGFNINNPNQCISLNSFNFSSTSTITTGTLTYQWFFGDGGSSILQNPSYSYSISGTFDVRLIIKSNTGCVDSIKKTITVYPKPFSSFTINNAGQCISGNTFSFINTSTISAGTLNFQWLFGDGGSSTLQNAVHSYTTSGTYVVKLICISANGCRDTTSKNVTVHPKPTASFSINDTSQCLSGNNFAFTNLSTVSTGTFNSLWNFGDASTSASLNPVKIYSAVGIYTVKLIITSDKGCIDSTKKTVYVNPKPAPSFSINNSGQCFKGNSFSFTNTTPNTLGALTYNWSFGDGVISNSTSPVHVYSVAGSYNVKLIAVAGNGCKDSTIKIITVSPQPLISFTINDSTQCFKANNFVFTNLSTIATGNLNYNWSFGDGGFATTQNATRNYTVTGTFVVKLVTTSDKGCKDSLIKPVVIYTSPLASYTINQAQQCLKGNKFLFANTSVTGAGTFNYKWNFGDGTFSAIANPQHIYTASGSYPVKLLVYSTDGCADSVIQTVVVSPQPLAAFAFSIPAQCLNGNNFVFNNTSNVSSGTMSYSWFFGDGNNSSTQNPVHVYTNFGSFSVKLVVVTNNGCKDSLTKNAIVYPKPNPAFTVNTSTQCIGGNTFSFTNTSVIGNGTMTYLWKFGDGTFSTSQSVTHSYAIPGIYNVTLVATSNNSCKDSVSKSITIQPKPKADFTINNANQCFQNNTFNFTNTSILAGGSMTHEWNFGDGTTSTNTNAVYSYSLPGNYIVKLIVTSPNGCKDTAIKNVVVYAMPVADFTMNTTSQCRLNNSFVFTNTSTVVNPATYNWSFGDGNTSALQNPTHTYSSHGNFTVRLIVISANGCRDTISKPVIVYPMPTASFNINKPAQCLKNNLFQFLNNSTISSGSLLFQWYFGDGTSANTISPVHTYTAAGVYTVKLIVTTGFGCKDSTTRQITVDPQSIPDFTINKSTQCLTGNSFSFTNISSVLGVVTYNWSFGDGSTSTATDPVYIYTAAGVYNVTLQVVTASGCLDTLTRQVTVYPQPTVSYTVNNVSQCLPGNLFTFTNNSVPVTGVSFLWKFGDGITSTAKSPVHMYTVAGAYDVVLRVTTNFGCFDSLIRSVKVNPKPNALFTINAPNQCYNGNSFTFSNNNTIGTLVTYTWTFGDGAISNVQNPAHVYTLPGNYTVQLKITTDNGCTDSSSKTVIVYNKPIASFAPNNLAQCLTGNSFLFSNNSTIGSGSFSSLWNFGDGQTSTAISPMHSYNLPGTYKVKLIVTSNNGCKDSTFVNVLVNKQPQASFIVNNAGQCVTGNLFSFSNTSVSEGSSNYYWTFGDGTSSSAFSPLHAYSTSGTFNVKLVITSVKGCKDSIATPVIVFPKPVAAFTTNLNAQCFETNNFLFTNNSSITNGSITSLWNFGDGSTSAVTNTSHTYTASGSYNVKLVVNSDKGCKDSTIKNVIVNPKPTADYNINDTAQCLKGNIFRFADASVISTSGVYQWNFGDGNTSLAQNPVHTYSNAGTYNVVLKVFTVAGCTDSIVRRVIVYPNANASFSVNQTIQCIKGNSFLFNNTSTVAQGTLSFFWSFGDGVTSVLQQPTHSYSISGNYSPQLVITTDKGCLDTARVNVEVNPNPSALFNINNDKQCLRGNDFAFTNTTSGTLLNYKWSFGDGATSVINNASHTYSSSGTFTVQLIATSAASCRDTVVRTIVVHPMPQSAFAITTNGNCSNNNNYAFSNTSSISSGTLNYTWSFGDGINSNAINPTHTFTTADTFAVRLVALSDKGCRDTTRNNIIVLPKPTASFTINKAGQCVNNNNFIFSNTSTALSPSSYLWSLGNGDTASTVNASSIYNVEGNYTIRLLVNGAGCLDSVSKTITVYPKPFVSFDVNKSVQCLVDNSYILTNKSSIITGTLTYKWLFDDGNISVLPNPIHAYNAAGNYTIKQIAFSNFNCVDSTSQTIQVLVNPRARFTVNNNTQCLSSNNFVFVNNSIAPAGTTYTWSLGDGTLSYTISPTKTYKAAAAYKVTLYLSGTNGCKSDTATTSVSVIPNPVVNAGEDIIVTEGKTVRLNARVDNGLTFQWSPSTYLNSTTLQNPLVTPYQNIGYKLLAIGQNGCTGSDSVYVKILKTLNIPNVFSPNGDGVNDKWVIRSLSDYPGCTVEVFNRYGSLVFSSIGYRNPWDGTKNGNPLPAGVYYYIVDPKNGVDKVAGHVTILR